MSNFEEIKSQFLMDIMASVTMEEIPDDMIINWDQTAMKFIPYLIGPWLRKGQKESRYLA